MLGLKWDDGDFGRGVLHVSRTLSETCTGYKFEKPKNGTGRAVKLSQGAPEALKSHRARQNEERRATGSAWQDDGLVFPTTTGTTMRYTNLMNRHFLPLLERAGLPRVRLHDLRHTCATILLRVGQHSKYVQEFLGHANISITLDVYSHVLPGWAAASPTRWTARWGVDGALLPSCATEGYGLDRDGDFPGYISPKRPLSWSTACKCLHPSLHSAATAPCSVVAPPLADPP